MYKTYYLIVIHFENVQCYNGKFDMVQKNKNKIRIVVVTL